MALENTLLPAEDAGELSLDEEHEVPPWSQLFFEFTRAVVPLTVFIIVYSGFVFRDWLANRVMLGGLGSVIVGLAIFKYGLLTGLMPFGETIGLKLPGKASPPLMGLVIFILGVLVTFSEPGINSLQIVGGIMEERASQMGDGSDVAALALLVRILGKARSFQLLCAVAVGVGLAATVGVLRLRFRIGMKTVIVASLLPPLCLTLYCALGPDPTLKTIIGVSWDCGAITTGPATVPIVLALGVGVADATGEASDLDGFGIVTLASLYPILTVLIFGMGNELMLQAEHSSTDIFLHPVGNSSGHDGPWSEFPLEQLWQSIRAVFPLVTFLNLVQIFLIRERRQNMPRIVGGVVAVFTGLFFFNCGLHFGSIPLGEQAGEAAPDSLQLYSGNLGLVALLLFGFVAGFIATIIDLEPCGLGEKVEKLSCGTFTKKDLFASVAFGVGVGVMLGFAKVVYSLDLVIVLVIAYSVALLLTYFAEEGLTCIAWDSAGVTTGPVTVPLVLSMGEGICKKVGATEGFGILACASVCPIISVLAFSIWRTRFSPRTPDPMLSPRRRASMGTPLSPSKPINHKELEHEL